MNNNKQVFVEGYKEGYKDALKSELLKELTPTVTKMITSLPGTIMEIIPTLIGRMHFIANVTPQKELSDKHWEECRQIALYDDELKKAKALLKKLSSAEYTKHYDEETAAELFDYLEGKE